MRTPDGIRCYEDPLPGTCKCRHWLPMVEGEPKKLACGCWFWWDLENPAKPRLMGLEKKPHKSFRCDLERLYNAVFSEWDTMDPKVIPTSGLTRRLGERWSEVCARMDRARKRKEKSK